MPTIIAQHKGQFATQRRDSIAAKQELHFPRGSVNHSIFHNNLWEINKDSFNERYTKIDCCNIVKGGNVKCIDCAFTQIHTLIPNAGTRTGLR
tara:strand:- start:6488 stop:6766 length:279 start_codon:yes stop_codon:yes gene_type:complete